MLVCCANLPTRRTWSSGKFKLNFSGFFFLTPSNGLFLFLFLFFLSPLSRSSSRSFNPLVFRLDVGGEAAKGGEGEGKRVKSLGELVMQTQEAEKRAEENEIDFDNLIAGLRRERGLDNDALASLFQVREEKKVYSRTLSHLSLSPRSVFLTLLMLWFPPLKLPNVTGMFLLKWKGSPSFLFSLLFIFSLSFLFLLEISPTPNFFFILVIAKGFSLSE